MAPAFEKLAGARGIIVPLFAGQTPADEHAEKQSSTEDAEQGSPGIVPHVALAGLQCLAGFFFRRFPSLRRAFCCTLSGCGGSLIRGVVVIHIG